MSNVCICNVPLWYPIRTVSLQGSVHVSFDSISTVSFHLISIWICIGSSYNRDSDYSATIILYLCDFYTTSCYWRVDTRLFTCAMILIHFAHIMRYKITTKIMHLIFLSGSQLHLESFASFCGCVHHPLISKYLSTGSKLLNENENSVNKGNKVHNEDT